MAIDSCPHSFQELATDILPKFMQQMRDAMAQPHPMQKFAVKGVGPKSILRGLDRKDDFAGCYVFLEQDRPIYVGISRSIIQRLLQHVKGRTQYSASLAYRIASWRRPHDLTRKAAMEIPAFRKEFEKARDYLKSLYVAFIEIDNDLELYLFEAYCAMELDTSEWNTFCTH